MSVFQLDDFKLNSGRLSKLKIEADNLTYSDIETFAYLIKELIGPFRKVVGVPRGGLGVSLYVREICS